MLETLVQLKNLHEFEKQRLPWPWPDPKIVEQGQVGPCSG